MSIGKNTALGLATNVAIFGLGIVLSIVLTRSLGAEQRGVYTLLVTTNILLANIASLSVGAAFSNALAKGRYSLGQVNTIALLLSLALGAVCVIGVSLAFPYLHGSVFPQVPYGFMFVALLIVAAAIYQMYWSYIMMGLNRLLPLNTLNLAVNISNAVLIILLVGVLRLGIPGFLVAWVASNLGGMIAAIVMTARMEPFAWPPSGRAMLEMLGFGLRGHGASIAHHIFLRLDMYIVSALVGTAGVGIYSLSTSLAEKLWLPVNTIHSASLGKITQLPREESALLTAKVTRAVVLIILAIAVPFGIASPWLIPFLYGEEFAAAVLPLVILLAGVLCFAVMLVVNNYIVGQMERPGLLTIISWFQLGVSILLYVTLISRQGIVGAAIASSLTYLLAMACTLYVFVRDSRLRILQVLVPRSDDFRDYKRVLCRGAGRIPVLNRYLCRPTQETETVFSSAGTQ